MKKIFLIVPILVLLNGCTTQSIIPDTTCEIKVPTISVQTFRDNGRRIFENMCEIEQKQRCDSLYIDEVEKFAYSPLSINDLKKLRAIQKNQCN